MNIYEKGLAKALRADDSKIPLRWKLQWKFIDPWWEYSWAHKLWRDRISPFLWPRQKWLTDAIPKTWNDKRVLIPDILYLMVVHYVDGEKAFESIDFEASGLGSFAKELKEVYDWAKVGRKELQKKIDDSYPDLGNGLILIDDETLGQEVKFNLSGNGFKSYEELYGEVNRLEAELEDSDTKCLEWIVRNRNHLWT